MKGFMMERCCALLVICLAGAFCVQIPNACAEVRIPESVHNFLVDAKIRGNLESYGEGLRGEVDHMIYDLQRRRFVKSSQWHEYGVGFGRDLGIVADAFSTLIFALGVKKGAELLESMPSLDGVFITKELDVHVTTGIQGLFSISNPDYHLKPFPN